MVAPKKKHDHITVDQPDYINEFHTSSFASAFIDDRKVIKGHNKSEKLNGTNGADKINGRGGNDTINGRGGNDQLIGGTGSDRLDGGTGNDILIGGEGNDRLTGGTGRNVIKGGSGIDTAVLSGSSADYDVAYEDGMMILSRRGSRDTLDQTVEKIKLGDMTIDRQVIHFGTITGIETGHGTVGDAGKTIDTTVIIHGTADAFARVTVRLDDAAIGTVVASADGTWSFDYSGTRLSEGSHAFSTMTDWGGSSFAIGLSTTITVAPAVDAATLSASQGFVVIGAVSGDRVGFSVSSLGDINGDGFQDLIVGTPYAGSYSGSAYVIFGSGMGFGTDVNGQQVIDLATLSASQGFVIPSEASGDSVGWSVSSAGDVNGDGFDDLIVGAPYNFDGGFRSGNSYVIFGTADGFGMPLDGRQEIDLTALGATKGFIIRGASYDNSGRSVSSAGDVNGDGFDDLIVGAPMSVIADEHYGVSYVIFGTASGFGTDVDGRQVIDVTTLGQNEGFIIQGVAADDYAGSAVSSAGDINDDGFADLLVGTRGNKAYLVFGTAAGFGENVSGRQVIDLAALTADQGFVIVTDDQDSHFQLAVAAAGDVNGDGYDDMIVSTGRGDLGGEDSGQAYVIFGTAAGFGEDVGGVQVLDLAGLAPSEGFVIQGNAANDRTGFSVSSAGDFNGDGFDDLIVGSLNSEQDGAADGAAYVIFGTAAGFGTAVGGRQLLDLSDLTVDQGFLVVNSVDEDTAGSAVSAGDLNGDGFDDIIVGAKDAGPDEGETGGAYIVYGGTFGSNTHAVTTTGTFAAEILMGGAGDDVLTGGGGADIYRSGAGDDRIVISDNDFFQIDAGGGRRDTVVFSGGGIQLDARDFANSKLTGIEAFDITGSGNNKLTLDAVDVFHIATTGGHADFTGAESHRNVVVLGNAGDVLDLRHDGRADIFWFLHFENKALDMTTSGGFDTYVLRDADNRDLATVAVDSDVTVLS